MDTVLKCFVIIRKWTIYFYMFSDISTILTTLIIKLLDNYIEHLY